MPTRCLDARGRTLLCRKPRRMSKLIPKLTDKEEKFSQLCVEGNNNSDAYRGAYKTENMKQNTIWSNACQLRGTPKVALRIEELQAEHKERHNVTVDTLTQELEDAREVSKGEKQGGGMVQATMGKAKIHGMITDKVAADVNLTINIKKFTTE